MALASATSAAAAPCRVIVTRPAREAQTWADALQARGVPCETFPLIEIAALPEPSALESAWQAVPGHLALMFVSANAVRFFMAARPAGLPMPSCRAWSTGPGTRAISRAAIASAPTGRFWQAFSMLAASFSRENSSVRPSRFNTISRGFSISS